MEISDADALALCNATWDAASNAYEKSDISKAISLLELLVRVSPNYKDAAVLLKSRRTELAEITLDVERYFRNIDACVATHMDRRQLATFLQIVGRPDEAVLQLRYLADNDQEYLGRWARKKLTGVIEYRKEFSYSKTWNLEKALTDIYYELDGNGMNDEDVNWELKRSLDKFRETVGKSEWKTLCFEVGDKRFLSVSARAAGYGEEDFANFMQFVEDSFH